MTTSETEDRLALYQEIGRLAAQKAELRAALETLLDDVSNLTAFSHELPGVQQARAALARA